MPDDRPAVFLDRDGVINEELNYVHRIEDFHFLPGVLAACRELSQAGYLLVVITNQAGIARGYYDVAQFEALTVWMKRQFSEAGAPLAGVYYCPHHPEGKVEEYRKECACRKPAPGMLLQAQRELGIDFGRSILVGDKLSDIEAGRAVGVGRYFLISHASSSLAAPEDVPACKRVTSLSEVVELIRPQTDSLRN